MAENILTTPPAQEKKKPKMVWCEFKDAIMCRQVLAKRPYQHKKWSGNLTDTWKKIVAALWTVEGFEAATVKGVRDRLDNIVQNRERERRRERTLSGVEIIDTQFTQVVDDLIEDMAGCQQGLLAATEAENAKAEKENEAAHDVRNAAVESSETKTSSSKKARSSGTETVRFLMERQESAKVEKEKEMEFKKEELALRKKEIENQSQMMSTNDEHVTTTTATTTAADAATDATTAAANATTSCYVKNFDGPDEQIVIVNRECRFI